MATHPVFAFDPIRILQQLSADGVEFVLIGESRGESTVADRDQRSRHLLSPNESQLWAACQRRFTSLTRVFVIFRLLPVDDRCEIDLAGTQLHVRHQRGFFRLSRFPEEGASTGYDELATNAQPSPLPKRRFSFARSMISSG